MTTQVVPQAYPLDAMVVGEDRYDLDPEFNRDPVEPIGPADLCMVIGWDQSAGDVDELVPVLAQIDDHFSKGESPIWPVNGTTYYMIRTALPTEADRTYFAQRVAAIVQAELARKRGSKGGDDAA